MAESEMVTAHLKMWIAGAPLAIDLTVPKAPARLGELLPVFQSLADAVVGTVVESVESSGRSISCRAGCGACCRQLVPISEVEARGIRDLVERLPEPRRSQVRLRFAEARRRLEEAGMLEPLLHPGGFKDADRVHFGLAYFHQQIPCPFLEEESCSIHRDRPIACREYLVTSPAENCARPSAETVRCVKMPRSVWAQLARFDPVERSAELLRWVPLIVAPEWADAHPEEPAPRPAPEWLGDMIRMLAELPPESGPVVPTPHGD
jgi:Fe-S-cluster containining protein